MIVVMRPDATEQEVQHVVKLIRDLELTEHIIHGSDLTVVAVIGDDRKKDGSVLEQAPGVDRVMKVLAPYKMAADPDRRGSLYPRGVGMAVRATLGRTHIRPGFIPARLVRDTVKWR